MGFKFGDRALEDAYKRLKLTLQCPHIYKTIKESVVQDASTWVWLKWKRSMKYAPLLEHLGVKIVEG